MTGTTPHRIAGDIVRDEIALQRLTATEVAIRSSVARSTIYRVLDGDPRVSVRTLRRVEAALGLPQRFLTAVTLGDCDRIRQAPGIRSDLRDLVLYELSESVPAHYPQGN
jgi:transcriptional regulator with XRE-family HTH domain